MLNLYPARYRSRFCNSVVRFTDSGVFVILIPTMNRWAIFDRPLRGLSTNCSAKRQRRAMQ